ncbi:MAG: hypothetical protein Q8R28_05705, partial [Dehalococcoidia bacterium]|nr:hypothetical protein [Dehalococcoidia bacterium]
MLVKVPVYRLPEGTAICDLLDGPAKGQATTVLELSAAGARLACAKTIAPLTYMDCRLRLETGIFPLFACALGWRQGILRLRWLHFDKGELQPFMDRLSSNMNSSWRQGEVELPEPRQMTPAQQAAPQRDLIETLVQAEVSAAAGVPYDAEVVSLLERKVARLAGSLEAAESLIERLRREVASGAISGGAIPPGLQSTDPAQAAKSDL